MGSMSWPPQKDIAEVKNAYEIYERLDELDPYSVDDLLTAHGIMTRGLVEESGMFRTRPVGVVDSEGHVLHFGTLPQYVPDLVMELLEWAKTSEIHMLIRSCVFHYELELIHPFADGNGRVGRCGIRCCCLSGIRPLPGSRWNPSSMTDSRSIMRLSMSPMTQESLRYLSSFMLSAIKTSLVEAISTRDEMSGEKIDKATLRWNKIQEYLKIHDYIMNADVRETMWGIGLQRQIGFLVSFCVGWKTY